MLRVKCLSPALMPVVVGAALLWYRSKKKALKAHEESEGKNADNDSANGSEDPSQNATPTARRSPLLPKRNSCNNNLDSGANSSDEAPLSSVVDDHIDENKSPAVYSNLETSVVAEINASLESARKTWEPLPEPRTTQQQPQPQRGATSKRNSPSASSADITTSQDPSDPSANNGIVVTYPEAPSASSKSRWNNNGARTANGATPSPPLPPPAQSNHQHVVYEFEFPTELIGRLIGKGGRNLQQMMKETGTQIGVRRQQCRPDHQIVTVQGRHADIQKMLKSVRTKFPRHHHPEVDIRPINVPMPQRLMMPETLWMTIPEGAPVNAVVVSVLSAGHIFIQLPSHPTFPNLPRLDACMLACYTSSAAPPVDTSLQPGQLCAAPLCGGWFRAQVVQVVEAPPPSTENGGSGESLPGMLCGQEAYLRWVDYGGYSQVPIKDLRQCRSDFMTLPFQAIECYLGNVSPPHSEDGGAMNPYDFPIEGAFFLEESVKNSIIEVEVVAYAEDGLPCVHLFKNENGFGADASDPTARTLINRELVERGFATWVEGISSSMVTGHEFDGDVFE